MHAQPRPGELVDDARDGDAPDASALVERMLELVASEAEALLAGDDREGRLADLNVRTALASWDALRLPDQALRFLELADGHPLAPRLRLTAALASGDASALSDAEHHLGQDTGALAIELAEAWLWRHGRADRAAAVADRLLEAELPDAWRAHVRELATIAHAALGRWDRVVALRTAALGPDTPPAEVAATAALWLDRADDALGALDACWERLACAPAPTPTTGAEAIGWLRVIDVGLLAATVLDAERRRALLEKRAELIAALPGGELDALATRHAIAAERERAHEHAQAAALWTRLAADPAASLPAGARRIAHLHAAWAAAGARDPATGLIAQRNLAADAAGCSEVATAHAWRALELAALTGDASMGDLARVVADAFDGLAAERWLDVLEVAAPSSATIARFELRGELFVRWAAAIAERRGDTARALQLWQRAATTPTLPTTSDHLIRLYRAGTAGPPARAHQDELAAAYAAWAHAEREPRSAAALWCARGVVDLARGDLVDAEESLRHAADLDPHDPFCRAALAAVYRAGKRHELLAQQLAQLATSSTSPDARAQAAREYAELLDEHLGDPAAARAALERMIVERPQDAEAMLVLARLCDRDQAGSRALELRRRAVEAVDDPARRAEIWFAIAQGEDRRGETGGAAAAFERARGFGHPDAARELVRLHRRAGHRDQALALVRAELAGELPLARRMQLQHELAQLLTELGEAPEAAVAAYLDVLSLEPDQPEALAGIEAPARALGLWHELARAFRGAAPTPRNLEVLAEALTHLGEWAELAEVRRRQLDAATTPADRAQRAAELARLYEVELGDLDAAIGMLQLAQGAHRDRTRQDELLRLLRHTQRWPEAVAMLERELAMLPPTDTDRRVAILVALGELHATGLGRPAEAAALFERVLERQPGHPGALAALEAVYEQLGKERELARVLEARADATPEPAARAQLLARVAGLRANRGDVDGALAAYTAAFAADPSNRDVFTSLEHVCYKAERWAVAMQLYDLAIAHVENGASRAYRLGDLYARRGNVQLNFLGQRDEALASYQKVIEVEAQPDAAVKIVEDLCARRGDWRPLIAAYERRAETQRDPTRKADALRAAGRLAAEHGGDERHSIRIHKKLLTVDPMDAAAVESLERFYTAAGDRGGLVDVLKLRLEHARTEAESIDLLLQIARSSEEGAHDVETATEHYHKILELQPDHRDALEALGRIYESTERWAELIEITRKHIKVTNDRSTKALLYFRAGSVMEAKFGREHDAIRYYDAAIKASAACLPAVHGLRDLYRRRQEWQRVIETLELEVKLWQDDKERAGVFAQIGRVHAQQLGDAERALQFYESALAVDPECVPANQALFDHHFEQRAWDKAQPLAEALAQKAMREGDPTTRSEFYRRRGLVARMTGDPRAAAESFVVALEIKPSNAAALDELGALARERPDAWDFESTYRELDKLYKRRDDTGPLLARVHVGRAAIVERDGDLDRAAELYRHALELAPTDLVVLSALVEFHAKMRRWDEAITAIERFVRAPELPAADRLAARMRQATLHADGQMDAHRAVTVLHEVIAHEPAHQDAYYLLAQQYFLLGQHADARTAIDRVIELASAPGQPLSAEALARYYYYKGRILDAAGDARAAAPQYRRAIEYDPGYAPPALVLARRAAEAGDQRQAEALLIDAAHAAMAQGGPPAAVPLQRGLARILLASGDRPAAIEAYRGILNVAPDSASDRVALAEIYAVDDPARAIGELRKVLGRDIHHAPAYRLLASFYSRTGQTERAHRVLTALDLLGFAEETDRRTAQRVRAARAELPLRSPLRDDARERLLVTNAARDPLGEVFAAFAAELTAMVSQPSLGENLRPAHGTEPRLVQLAAEIGFLYETEAEVFIGEQVPGLAAVTAFPRRLLVLDRTLLAESDRSLRFVFGYAFEAIRGGYATLLQLGARQRRELAALLRSLVALDEPTGLAAELVNNASAEAQAVLEAHAGIRDVDAGAWIDGMIACAKRAGLLACDDFGAAIWTVARLAGEQLASHDEAVALGSVLGGPDLVRFYLSDEYQQLRDLLTAA